MAIAHDATTPNINSANSTGESFAHTCTGSNLTLVAIVLLFGVASNGVSAITYNGVSMGTAKASREYNYTINRYLTALIFTLDSPAAGENTFAVTFNGTAAANAIILTSYTGANNGVGVNSGGADGTDDTPTTSFDTDTAGGLIVAGATVLGADTDPFTPGADVTERSDGDTGGGSVNTDIGFTTGDKVATGGSDTIAFTASAADFWTIVAIELNEAAGGGGTPIGLNSETDAALAMTAEKSKATGLPAETDTPLPLVAEKSKAAGLVSETDTPLAMTRVKSKALGLITETDVVLPVTAGGETVVGIVTEADTPLGLTRVKSKAIGIVEETAVPLGLAAQKSKALGMVQETAVVFSFTRHKTAFLGFVSETSTVLALAVPGAGSVVRFVTIDGEFETAVSLEGEYETAVSLVGEFEVVITLAGEL